MNEKNSLVIASNYQNAIAALVFSTAASCSRYETGGSALTRGVDAGGVGGVTEAALRRSRDSCNCFCWLVSRVFSVARSLMMSPCLIS